MAKLRMAIPTPPENQVCFGCGKEMVTDLLHEKSHDGILFCLCDPEDGRQNPKPIVYDNEEKMYYFFDKTWTDLQGPFDTFPEVVEALTEYIQTLEQPTKGEVGMAVGKAEGKVVIDFGSKPVKYVALDPFKARDIAQAIFTLAAELIREADKEMERGLKDKVVS